ncbi:hypothetical protein ACFLSU_02185 [Bacteroidota bacterium]
MIRFFKIVSIIFHPILLPFIGALYYFSVYPNSISNIVKTQTIGIIFASTYIIPIILLFLLKKTKKIDSYNIVKIEQRKNPIIFMIVLFLTLGSYFIKSTELIGLAIVFIGNSFGLCVVYFLFARGLKTSLHSLGMGTVFGFLIFLGIQYQINIISELIYISILSGIVAQARLRLNAHTLKEVSLGYIIGLFTQIIAYNIYIPKF